MQESLYTFRCLLDYHYKEVDRVQKQNKFLESIGIDKDFSNDEVIDIRDKCKKLGLNGWVISPFWHPNVGETWYNTWFDLVKCGKKEKIADFFRDNNYQLLNYIRGYARFEVEKYNWWTEAEDLLALSS